MSDTFVVCAALKPGAEDSVREKALIKVVESLCNRAGSPTVISNEEGLALLRFDEAGKASRTANELLAKVLHVEGQGPDIEPISVAIDGGTEQDPTKLASFAQRLATTQNEPNQIVITHGAYDKLPLEERDAYRAEEQFSGRPVHRRFASGSDACFVISPIGKAESADRTRANFIIDEYVKRACAELNLAPYRSDQRFSSAIRRDMLSSLTQSKVVVAYLGSPPWNPNVMMEIGYRLAAGGAIVMLRDSIVDAEHDDELPFDISDMQVLQLPPKAAEGDAIRRDAVAGELVKAMNQALTSKPHRSPNQPFMQVEIDRHGQDHIVRQATPAAAALLAHKGVMVGTKVANVMSKVVTLMPEGQANEFGREQGELLTQLIGVRITSDDDPNPNVTARIPMVFENHPDPAYDQKAFLPVIVRYDGGGDDDRLLLNILYLDVTTATRINEDNIFECRLEGVERSMLLWDNYAVSYDNVLTRLGIYKDAVTRHVKALTDERYKRVLDIGAGTGNVTIPLAQLGKYLTAVDRSEAMLLLMRKKLLKIDSPGVTIYEQSAESLPFDDNRFDAVSILLALFAMETPTVALDEAIRVLKPGGMLVLTEPKSSFKLAPLLEYAEKELSRRGELDRFAADWRRVTAVNKRIDPSARLKLPVEQIADILTNRDFMNITHEDSHLGYCEFLTAKKPG